jgi:hypothetical protein
MQILGAGVAAYESAEKCIENPRTYLFSLVLFSTC